MPKRRPLEERLWEKVVKTETCWLWTGCKANGYGQLGTHIPGAYKRISPHVLVYQLLVGPIPDGYQIDHLCRTPLCCRPDHLEAVTPRTNYLRGVSPPACNARKTHCKRGHPLDEANLYSPPHRRERHCLLCKRELQRAWDRQRKSQRLVAQ